MTLRAVASREPLQKGITIDSFESFLFSLDPHTRDYVLRVLSFHPEIFPLFLKSVSLKQQLQQESEPRKARQLFSDVLAAEREALDVIFKKYGHAA